METSIGVWLLALYGAKYVICDIAFELRYQVTKIKTKAYEASAQSLFGDMMAVRYQEKALVLSSRFLTFFTLDELNGRILEFGRLHHPGLSAYMSITDECIHIYYRKPFSSEEVLLNPYVCRVIDKTPTDQKNPSDKQEEL